MYAELVCRTNYSFLQGASHPQELAKRAQEVGLAALAVTDENSLAGVVRAHVAAKEVELRLMVGAIVRAEERPPLVLWAMDRAGYGRLSRMITCGRRNAPKGEFRLSWDELTAHAEGLLAGVFLNSVTHATSEVSHASPVNERRVVDFGSLSPEMSAFAPRRHAGPSLKILRRTFG